MLVIKIEKVRVATSSKALCLMIVYLIPSCVPLLKYTNSHTSHQVIFSTAVQLLIGTIIVSLKSVG